VKKKDKINFVNVQKWCSCKNFAIQFFYHR